MSTRALATLTLAVALAAAAVPAQQPAEKSNAPEQKIAKSKTVTRDERVDALSRAAVWHAPAPIARANLGNDARTPASIECTFEITELGGTAQKFDCRSAGGDRLRIKYGRSPEIPSEVATAKLLHALGFGTDNMRLVQRVRCYGCPAEPFVTMKTLGLVGAEKLYGKVMNPSEFKDFEWAAVERRHVGRAIETEEIEGWAFFELDLIDPAKGGAPKSHVDALRLLAVMLSHWDNKSENQRLVCLSEKDWPEGGKCSRPFAMLQDVGSAWGPRKVDLPEWEKASLWSDRANCTTSMDSLPYHGATFKPTRITEAGRKHLARLLSQLSDGQIGDLFRSARFDQPTGFVGRTATPIAGWVRVFKKKVAGITGGPSCPQ